MYGGRSRCNTNPIPHSMSNSRPLWLHKILIGTEALVGLVLVIYIVHVQIIPTRIPPSTIAQQVAVLYGERHPHTIMVEKTTDEVKSEPMYIVVMSGHFRETVSFGYIIFAAMADRMDVWYVYGYKSISKSDPLRYSQQPVI